MSHCVVIYCIPMILRTWRRIEHSRSHNTERNSLCLLQFEPATFLAPSTSTRFISLARTRLCNNGNISSVAAITQRGVSTWERFHAGARDMQNTLGIRKPDRCISDSVAFPGNAEIAKETRYCSAAHTTQLSFHFLFPTKETQPIRKSA